MNKLSVFAGLLILCFGCGRAPISTVPMPVVPAPDTNPVSPPETNNKPLCGRTHTTDGVSHFFKGELDTRGFKKDEWHGVVYFDVSRCIVVYNEDNDSVN